MYTFSGDTPYYSLSCRLNKEKFSFPPTSEKFLYIGTVQMCACICKGNVNIKSRHRICTKKITNTHTYRKRYAVEPKLEV